MSRHTMSDANTQRHDAMESSPYSEPGPSAAHVHEECENEVNELINTQLVGLHEVQADDPQLD